jgi:hypothetical protein
MAAILEVIGLLTYREFLELQQYGGMTEDEKLAKRNLEMIRQGVLRKPKGGASEKEAADRQE